MVDKVIKQAQTNAQNVKKYNFSPLDVDDFEPSSTKLHPAEGRQAEELQPSNNIPNESRFDEPAPNAHHAAQSGMLEDLLKKVDELSTGMIKMEMQTEKQQAEFAARLEEERARALEEGYAKASSELAYGYTQKENENLRMFATSTKKLDDVSASFAQKISQIESELIQASLSIAEEVIKCETAQNSKKIASSLAKELFAKLKDASQITLRANAGDVAALNEALGQNPKVKIESDDAIMRGGVVLLSDLGNLDGTIASRLEKIRLDLSKD